MRLNPLCVYGTALFFLLLLTMSLFLVVAISFLFSLVVFSVVWLNSLCCCCYRCCCCYNRRPLCCRRCSLLCVAFIGILLNYVYRPRAFNSACVRKIKLSKWYKWSNAACRVHNVNPVFHVQYTQYTPVFKQQEADGIRNLYSNVLCFSIEWMNAFP